MRKNQRILVALLIAMLVVTALPSQALGVTVLVKGHELIFQVPPRNEDGRLLVPMRSLFEELGCTVSWDADRKAITATTATGVNVFLQVGLSVAQVNGQIMLLDMPPKIVDGRTLVPLRFVAEALGADVKWDGTTQTAAIAPAAQPAKPSPFMTAPATTEDLLQRALPATVLIETNAAGGTLGSGFFLNDQGLIVTNYHVVKGATGLRTTTYDKKVYQGARVIAADPARDVAVLDIDAIGYAALPLDVGPAPKPGHKVIAVGNPMGLDWSVSEGMVPAERTIRGLPWIQHSAPISHGNSGGPLLSQSTGRIVGMNTMILEGDGVQNLNFATPVSTILYVLGNWQQNAAPATPGLPPARAPNPNPSPGTTPAPKPGPAPVPTPAPLPAMPAVGPPGDWVNPRGDLLNRGALSAGPGYDLKPAWTVSTVSNARLTLYKGVLYAAGGGSPGNLTAIDPTTGKVLWDKRLGTSSSGATAGESGVYISEYSQAVRAFKPDGSGLWLAEIRAGSTTPILLENQLIVFDQNGTVCALDPKSGDVLWKVAALESTNGPTAQPVIFGGRMYIPTSNKTLVFDLASHQWQTAIKRTSSPALLADNGYLYMTQEHRLYAVNPITGEDAWSVLVGDTVRSSPAAAGGLVVFAASDSNLYAVDGKTGRLAWTAPLDTYASGGPALIAGDLVYVGAYFKGLKVFKLRTGEQVAVLTPDYRVVGTPVATESALFVPNNQGGLTALVKK
jgi:S1-C subfamily serine protease/outer membrane protein assembly factor BamB